MFMDRYDSRCLTDYLVEGAIGRWKANQQKATVKDTGEKLTVGPLCVLHFGNVWYPENKFSDGFWDKEDRRIFKSDELVFE
jgi:hypothetical protein